MVPLALTFEYSEYKTYKGSRHHGPATTSPLEYTSVIATLKVIRLVPEVGMPRSKTVGNDNHPVPKHHVILLVPIDSLFASDGLVEGIG